MLHPFHPSIHPFQIEYTVLCPHFQIGLYQFQLSLFKSSCTVFSVSLRPSLSISAPIPASCCPGWFIVSGWRAKWIVTARVDLSVCHFTFYQRMLERKARAQWAKCEFPVRRHHPAHSLSSFYICLKHPHISSTVHFLNLSHVTTHQSTTTF